MWFVGVSVLGGVHDICGIFEYRVPAFHGITNPWSSRSRMFVIIVNLCALAEGSIPVGGRRS